ncbi:MAG: response regulator [Planctomycetaceae bacterium]
MSVEDLLLAETMANVSNTTGRSVLDEIRSTIASLEAIRGKAPAAAGTQAAAGTHSSGSGVAAEPAKAPTVPPATTPQNTGAAVRPPAAPAPSAAPVSAGAPSKAERPAGAAQSTAEDDVDSLEGATPGSETIVLRQANKDAKIMIVDDEPLNIMTFRQHLKSDGYSNFVTTEDPQQALMMIRKEQPDVLLLDIQMPGISGLDILRVVGLDPVLQHSPVLILTAATDPRIRRKALDLGANDFLSKPIDPNELLPRVRNAIILKQHYDLAANEAARLEQQVEHRTRQLEATRQQLIVSLARAAEHRDNDTGNHVIRVGRYAAIIASALGYPASKLTMLEQAAQLHDVGKIGIPDSILFKPGRLDPDQYELMKRHCAIGKQIIEPISNATGKS